MDRQKEILALLEEPMKERLKQGSKSIETYVSEHADEVASNTVAAFQSAAQQASRLQQNGGKGAIRYMLISHLYSSIQTGNPAAKLDLVDEQFYADRAEIEAYLPLKEFYMPLYEDMEYFKGILRGKLIRVQEYEWEQVRYRHVWGYHAVVREFLHVNIEALLGLPEYKNLEQAQGFEVLFGGYMDSAVQLWPCNEEVV